MRLSLGLLLLLAVTAALADDAIEYVGHTKLRLVGQRFDNDSLFRDAAGSTALDLIRIPRAALRGADQVLIVDDENRIEIRKVDIVRADEKYAYVGGGVLPGERITTTAIEAPTNGMSVRTADMLVEEDRVSSGQIASRADQESTCKSD